ARRLDVAHRAEWWKARQIRRDVGPVRAGIARHLHQAVVGAGPDQALLERRLGNREHDAGVFDADVVWRETAGNLLVRLVVEREVRTDLLPALSAVGRAVHVLAAGVERVVIV